jgi:hypothetical protein
MIETGFYEGFRGSDAFVFADSEELKGIALDLDAWANYPVARILSLAQSPSSATAWRIYLIAVDCELASSKFLFDSSCRIAAWLLTPTLARRFAQRIREVIHTKVPCHAYLDVDSIDIIASSGEYEPN